jgi:hypothetical protein
MHQDKVVKFTRFLLVFMFYGGIISVVTLPFSLRWLERYFLFLRMDELYLPMLIVFFTAGTFGVLILHQLSRMMKTVIKRNCFVLSNVTSLKRMGVYSFIISVAFLAKVLFRSTPATMIIILTFFVAGLFCYVLAFVFREAIQYKEENELTI